ncbi:MAG: methyl-accepting chemotaxis protein [Desulfovibrio sp.]|jgi:Na+-translocating ferredoxin:NAD+ oxidoreductase RNF subunit RnfB|nr:methyl-accepting chemotaxis protein [Desulfovibrio sp.]
MRLPITTNPEKCAGCNRCISCCPIEEANVAYIEAGKGKVRIEAAKCIGCGACVVACPHDSRSYVDDTERFFEDLERGTPISAFCSPAARVGLERLPNTLAWLRSKKVRKIYDVSLGDAICTWAYIRFIQKSGPGPIIAQACPAVVDYILIHRTDMLPRLAPLHSPMLCTAIYMRKCLGISDRLAAISPCIATSGEFAETGGIVSYNVTFAKLEEYIKKHGIVLPETEGSFDNPGFEPGVLHPIPGGIKKNMGLLPGKKPSVYKSEGPDAVYKALNEYAKTDMDDLPDVFDALSCLHGCNLGTGCAHRRNPFSINASLDRERLKALPERGQEHCEELFREFDKTLRLSDFTRYYYPRQAGRIRVPEEDIEAAFRLMGKTDPVSRNFNCGACGSETCRGMALKIAKKINSPLNCIQTAHAATVRKHEAVLEWQAGNARAIQMIQQELSGIKTLSEKIVADISSVDKMIAVYDALGKDIDNIARNIHMISLNASIEAARAGEYGKSFAVVAEAVRSLAGDTQGATAKIVKASNDAKASLLDIADMVKDIGSEIAKSHANMREIDESTQKVLSE